MYQNNAMQELVLKCVHVCAVDSSSHSSTNSPYSFPQVIKEHMFLFIKDQKGNLTPPDVYNMVTISKAHWVDSYGYINSTDSRIIIKSSQQNGSSLQKSLPWWIYYLLWKAVVPIYFTERTRVSFHAGTCETIDLVCTVSTMLTRHWYTFIDIHLAFHTCYNEETILCNDTFLLTCRGLCSYMYSKLTIIKPQEDQLNANLMRIKCNLMINWKPQDD